MNKYTNIQIYICIHICKTANTNVMANKRTANGNDHRLTKKIKCMKLRKKYI